MVSGDPGRHILEGWSWGLFLDGQIVKDLIFTPNCFVIPVHFMPHDRNKAELWTWNLLQTLYMYRTCGEFIKI